MTTQVAVRWLDAGALRSGGLADLASAHKAGTVWVDVLDPDEATLAALRDEFGLHPLAIEDTLHFPQRPKLEAYDGGPFIIWLTPKTMPDKRFGLQELDVFLGEGYIVTAHREQIEALDAVAAEAAQRLSRGPEWVLHGLLDRLVDGVLPLMDTVGDDLDKLEDDLMTQPDREKLRDLQLAKRRLRAFRRVVGPERDVLRELGRQQAFVSQDAYLYLQDVSDHLARIEDAIDIYRDVAASAMDIYLSAVSNNLNQVMKRLTVVATIFMPGTLIAGFYGMNVAFPGRDTPLGLATALAASALITGWMLWWFKKADWW